MRNVKAGGLKSLTIYCITEFEVWIGTAVTQASINFNSPAVPLPLTITCTDGNPANVITGTFNVNIVNAVSDVNGVHVYIENRNPNEY